jgi:PTH1 family peptidyl-tRNA hydrolase
MKAVIGLGNPGADYEGTRHNVGFDVIDELVRRSGVRLRKWKSAGDLAIAGSGGVVLAKPLMFMNASGEAVGRIGAFYKIDPGDLLVVVDEVHLPLGRLRLRPSGSAGGHNGLKSVIEHVGDGFPRLRIGVGRGDPQWDLSDHVLSRFRADERDVIERAIERAADAAEAFVAEGIGTAMNKFNAREDEAPDDQGPDRGSPDRS